MRVAVTGGTGIAGRFVVEEVRRRGWHLTILSRRKPEGHLGYVNWLPFDLDDPNPRLPAGYEALVHAAFDHVPGRYRGGEGDDAEGFVRRNVEGSLRLFRAARDAGMRRVVFLSSRAVFGGLPPGTRLFETAEPEPDTLYGQVKRDVEQALGAMSGPDFRGTSLRATGIYGFLNRGPAHKWADMFRNWNAGEMTEPRVATEVHGDDLADAVLRVLGADVPPEIAHVSDLTLDRHDLLAEAERLVGQRGPLPERSDASKVSALDCSRLHGLGWRPGGMDLLRRDLPRMLAEAGIVPR